MPSKTNERLTKQFVHDAVESGMDSQRQYAENLFHKSEERVAEQLKKALSTIRPQPVVQTETLADRNRRRLIEMKSELEFHIAKYEDDTGLRVRGVYIGHESDGRITTKVLVHNI